VLGFGRRYLSRQLEGNGISEKKKVLQPQHHGNKYYCVKMDHFISNGENKKYLQHYGV
jgi:hypothetical protein